MARKGTGPLRRLMLAAGLFGVIGASVSGCGGGGGGSSTPVGTGTGLSLLNGGNSVYLPTIPTTLSSRSACAANPHLASSTARWTVLVYMNASNDLQPFSLLNFAQMVGVGSDANVNIIVQWKQSAASEIEAVSGCTDCTPSFVGTRRYFVHAHPTTGLCPTIEDPGNNVPGCYTTDPDTVMGTDHLVSQDPAPQQVDPNTGLQTVDMGDYVVLNQFVTWGMQSYPADNYALVIWDHGSAWRPVPGFRAAKAPKKRTSARAVSQDYATLDEIETQQIQTALSNLPNKLDMVLFDCSLEGMTEVAYQISGNARTMVCSEESPPGAGYPYHHWLADLKTGGQNPCAVGTAVVSDFINYYPTQSDVTQSLIDLSAMPNVATTLQAFGTALYNDRVTEQNLIQAARNLNYVQSYGTDYLTYYAGLVDAVMYAGLIKQGTANSTVSAAATAFQNSYTNPTTGAVLYAGYGPTKATSSGLSLYVPDPSGQYAYLPSYAQLGLSAAAPAWNQFIQAQVK